jgi:hypothetical protein
MFDLIADQDGEDVHQDLPNDEKRRAKQDIAQWPSVVQGVHNQDDLGDHIDNECNTVDDKVEDPERTRAICFERTKVLEGGDGDGANDEEDDQGTDANTLVM